MPDPRSQAPASRASWGDGCPSDNDLAELAQGLASPAVRERVITHLDSCPDCTMLLAELALVVTPSTPQRIGRYEVVEQIGAGGMGVVYLARDPELNRRVALKLIRSELLDAGGASSVRARLIREAQLLAALTHPNVVAVHDVGEMDGAVFIAMEYVEGMTVSEWLRDHCPGWRKILRAYQQAGLGLAAAHAHNIVHRDVKPSNLLIGTEGRVRLTDFGLATVNPARRPPGSPDEMFRRLATSPAVKKHTGAALLVRQAFAAFHRRQGNRCLALLRKANGLVPDRGAQDVLRGWCTMLTGRCAAGKRLLRSGRRRQGLSAEQIRKDVAASVGYYCKAR